MQEILERDPNRPYNFGSKLAVDGWTMTMAQAF
jgi:hypothetical protein